MSDILWSFDVKNDKLKLPTNLIDPQICLSKTSRPFPYSLAQKTYIINDKTCITLAGHEGEMRHILKEFRNRCRYYGDEIPVEEIHRFLADFDLSKNFGESGFFIFHVNNERDSIKVGFFNAPEDVHKVDTSNFVTTSGIWNLLPDEHFEAVYAFGSGMKGYLNVINQRSTFQTQFEKGGGGFAFQTNSALIAKILALERASCYTIKDLWGAGFEVVYYDGQKFNKMSDIAYLICEGSFNDQGDIDFPIPRLIMFYRYANEILYITSLEIVRCTGVEVGGSVTITSQPGEFKQAIFEVPGIDLEDIDSVPMPGDFSFSTDHVAIGYLLEYNGTLLFNPSASNLSGSALNIKYQQNGKLEIMMLLELNEGIRKASQVFFNKMQKE